MPLDALGDGDIDADLEMCAPSASVPMSRKALGAYYTPDAVAASLCRWVISSDDDLLLDPACGDGRFIARHPNSIGVDQDPNAVREACEHAPHALVLQADFFVWAAEVDYRFDCVVGNPPFIRYQRFAGETRRRALALCAAKGAEFSGLTSAWAPFLVAAASLLARGGNAAFVVPAEIGHAPYAAPVLEYFLNNFNCVHLIAIREKLFPELSEDCWLLYAESFGGCTDVIRFTALERFQASAEVIPASVSVSRREWRDIWKCRLRPLLISRKARELYQQLTVGHESKRLRDFASVGIGYVSGGNEFFHLRPSKARKLDLPDKLLQPTVRSSRYLSDKALSVDSVDAWLQADEPVLLLNIPKDIDEVPLSVRRYLDSAEGMDVRGRYKCRNRQPWYSIPDVRCPDFFLSYLSGRRAGLVRNEANITCTNALHYVRLKEPRFGPYICQLWERPVTQLSCEVEGHPLGGGVLKLEPREAGAVLLCPPDNNIELDADEILHAIAVLQAWRHYC